MRWAGFTWNIWGKLGKAKPVRMLVSSSRESHINVRDHLWSIRVSETSVWGKRWTGIIGYSFPSGLVAGCWGDLQEYPLCWRLRPQVFQCHFPQVVLCTSSRDFIPAGLKKKTKKGKETFLDIWLATCMLPIKSTIYSPEGWTAPAKADICRHLLHLKMPSHKVNSSYPKLARQLPVITCGKAA